MYNDIVYIYMHIISVIIGIIYYITLACVQNRLILYVCKSLLYGQCYDWKKKQIHHLVF